MESAASLSLAAMRDPHHGDGWTPHESFHGAAVSTVSNQLSSSIVMFPSLYEMIIRNSFFHGCD
jgi:hypothetical protein